MPLRRRTVSGDRIGVLVDHDHGGSVCFFRNGRLLGEAFRCSSAALPSDPADAAPFYTLAVHFRLPLSRNQRL